MMYAYPSFDHQKELAKKTALADYRSRRESQACFVVFKCGQYHVANQFELDTNYAGIHHNYIVYSTLDD